MSETSATPARRGRKVLPPRRNKAAVWGFTVAFPLLVAIGIYFVEPPMDPGSAGTWIAGGAWIAIGVALVALAGRSKTKAEYRMAELALLLLLVGLLILISTSSALTAAATTLAGGFWGLFAGMALFFVYMFAYRRKLLFCRTCNDYRWMIRTGRVFVCNQCKTAWTANAAGPGAETVP